MGSQADAADDISEIADSTPDSGSADTTSQSPSVTDNAGNSVQLDDGASDSNNRAVET